MPSTAMDTDPFWDQFPAGAPRALVRAGFEAFAAQGFAATTTRDIAREAGLSPAGLYVHYPSKAALLHVLIRTGHEAARAVLEEALAANVPRVPRLARTVGIFAAWHARHHRIARVVQYELASLAPEAWAEIAELRREMQGRVADEIAAAAASGEADVPDVAGVARALMSLCIDVCRWYDPDGAKSPEQIGELYRELAARWLVVSASGGIEEGDRQPADRGSDHGAQHDGPQQLQQPRHVPADDQGGHPPQA